VNKLEQILQEKFPDKEIVTLEDLTFKIAVISKVRYGDNCTDNNYDEISLNNIDAYGTIYIPEDSNDPAPANHTALINQSLRAGDLIILHRGKVGKMGIIGEDYKRKIVGNNSMIRIQFDKTRKVDTPWFVMQYLQLPYVKEYIDTFIPSSGSTKRKILNSQILSNIPIPLFEECDGQYRELLFNRKQLSIEAANINKKLQNLISMYVDLQHDSIDIAINEAKSVVPAIYDDTLGIKELSILENQLTKILFKNK
jgi:hypothetical protein